MRKFFKSGKKGAKSKEDVSTVSVKSHSLQMIPGQEDSDDDGGYAGIDKNQCWFSTICPCS